MIENSATSLGGEGGKFSGRPLALWGGHECTVNRVGETWHDQNLMSGHHDRPEDLDLFASLGVSKLRYPALWERISPVSADLRDFAWTDERLPRIRALGMEPILTLCHHGSGPRYTSLVEDSFAPGLAAHAAAVAERYPWVEDWTPVNEPLTTARFSALYGYWYPHTRDEGLFWTALLNEIDATRLSMRAIRSINPKARLIQTDDLGFCHATEPLRAEAEFQNDRRWIGWDLLCGMVVPGHPLWARIAGFGLAERLRVVAQDPCPPDVIGVNHYLASERLLDHRLERHGERAVADRELGRRDGLCFVDVDAVRHIGAEVVGLGALLRQASERYGRTVAVTECHNGATREQQARWFVEVWRQAESLRLEGVDVAAVTAWSLLGSHDWNRMVTRFVGHYEVGVFDVRGGKPRETMVARVLRDLSAGRQPEVVGVTAPGWWRRSAADPGNSAERPLIIVGGDGPLARLVQHACEARGLRHVRRARLDAETFRRLAPWGVVDGRDWAGVCEEAAVRVRDSRARDPAGRGVDFQPPEALVSACARAGVACLAFGVAEDFDEADQRLLRSGGGRLLLARSDRVFTPWQRSRFAVKALRDLDFGFHVAASPDVSWDEVYGPDLVDVALDLLLDEVRGAVDLLPHEPLSAAEFARRLALVAEADPRLILDTPLRSVRRAPSPTVERLDRQPWLTGVDAMLERFVREARLVRRASAEAVRGRLDERRARTAS